MNRRELDTLCVNDAIETILPALEEKYDKAILTGPGEYVWPILDKEGNEIYLRIKISIPRARRNGDSYDPFTLAEDYAAELKEREEKARLREEREKLKREEKERKAEARRKKK